MSRFAVIESYELDLRSTGSVRKVHPGRLDYLNSGKIEEIP